MTEGFLITFDGIDKSGKTTQIGLLKKHLNNIGLSVHIKSSRDKNPIGRLINEIMEGCIKVPNLCLAYLFAAEGVYRKENEILPALKSGNVVLIDRYVYSAYAYITGSTK